MPIYIAVEVARRELEARLLLGLVAAERGHDVVLGKIPHGALLSGQLGEWRLPPGILHLKSIASSQRIYERLDAMRSQGSLVTVQDEEHGLSAQRDYSDFARRRFPAAGVGRVDRLMAWGPVDAEWFRSEFVDRAADVSVTGSPRIDLWRPDVIGSAQLDAPERDFILVVSSSSPFNRNPFWVQLYNRRRGAFGLSFTDDPWNSESAFFDRWSDLYRYVKHLTAGIRALAAANPDRTIIVRPHHFEVPEAWEAVLGEYPNVLVRADGPARAWVRHAAVVIHGGSTMAIEAGVTRSPIVAFAPEGFLKDSPANRLGRRAESEAELLGEVSAALRIGDGMGPAAGDLELLASRHAALDGPLAVDRIVDAWEMMLTPGTSGRIERIPGRAGFIEQIRRPLRALQALAPADPSSVGKGPLAMEVEHKFPSLDVDALRADAARLSEHLGRFEDVEIVRIGDREVLLRAAGR